MPVTLPASLFLPIPVNTLHEARSSLAIQAKQVRANVTADRIETPVVSVSGSRVMFQRGERQLG